MALSGTEASLEGNHIADNDASGSGGGLYIWDSDATLDGDVIRGNSAAWYGGGLFMRGKVPAAVNVVIADNSLGNNSGLGAGIYAEHGGPRLTHVTIARNSGGNGSGIHVAVPGSGGLGTIAVTNTIIAGHGVGITLAEGCTATVRGTLWHGNGSLWSGAGTVDHTFDRQGDPAFDTDGYHLTSRSVAINRGVEAPVSADIDGDDRPLEAGADIGADEFSGLPFVWRRLFLPLAATGD